MYIFQLAYAWKVALHSRNSQDLCAASQVRRVEELEAQGRSHADATAAQAQEVARLTAALEAERRKVVRPARGSPP